MAQRVARALARLWRRPCWLAAVLVLVAAPAWLVARPWVAQRVLAFELTLSEAGPQWSLEWERADDGVPNGVWLDLKSLTRSETLEIRPSGRAQDGDKAFEFWLYKVLPAGDETRAIDPRRLIEDGAATIEGHWAMPPPGVPGIVYADNRPGLLRVALPPGGVRIVGARTATGGDVTIRYADDERTVSCYARRDRALNVYLERTGLPVGQALRVRQPLPNYELRQLALRWHDSPSVEIELSRVELRETLLGRRIRARDVEPAAGPGAVASGADEGVARFRATDAAGQVLLPFEAGLGLRTHGVGYGLTLALLAALAFGVPTCWKVLRWLPPALRGLDACALYVVIAAHVWMAAWAPFLLLPDSIDYVYSPAVFLQTGNWEHIHPGRVPGHNAFVAPFMAWCDDFASAVGWVQATMGIIAAVLARGVLRPFVPRPWPVVGLLAVGLSPIALMYERILMSECLASFLAMLAAWLVVRLSVRGGTADAAPAATGKGARAATRCWVTGVGLAVLLGLVSGCAPYVRGNLQLIVMLVPVVLLLTTFRRGRRLRSVVQAATVGAVGVACLVPWVVRNHRLTGRWDFIVGKHYQRLEEASQIAFQLADDNQTRVFDYEHWREIRRKLGAEHKYALPLELPSSRLAPQPKPGQLRSHAAEREDMCRPVIDESLARRPWPALKGMAAALATQLGLWNKFPQSRAENAYWSLPLRGDLRGNSFANTNLMFDLDNLRIAEPTEGWKADVARRIRRDISYVVESPHARLFNEWFWAGQFVAPVCAVLFLIGLGVALWRGEYALVGVGLLPLGNATALAVLVISNVERYSVPFGGLLLVLAVYGAAAIMGAGRHAAHDDQRGGS